MAMLDKQVQVSKELSEVLDLVELVVELAVQKKSAAEIMGQAITPLMAALDGVALVKDELAQQKEASAMAVAMFAGKLGGKLLAGQPAEQPQP